MSYIFYCNHAHKTKLKYFNIPKLKYPHKLNAQQQAKYSVIIIDSTRFLLTASCDPSVGDIIYYMI